MSGSYGFRCRYAGDGDWVVSWVVDFYYSDSRLRFPRRFTRITDEAGMIKFANKHSLAQPNQDSSEQGKQK